MEQQPKVLVVDDNFTNIKLLEAVLAPLLLRGRAVSWVYAANTFGAVLGTLGTTFCKRKIRRRARSSR